MNEAKFNIAVLIDGDNAQSKLIKEIIEEVSKYGKATIRRIYGDWTTPHMNSWKDSINQFSISPIQKFAYTSGKNSTDSAMIIDAMDILHSKSVEGFCIVSSDSDYTGLAKRIREEGFFVMGIGRKTTPIAFVKSCEIFTFAENLMPKPKPQAKPTKKATTTSRKPKTEKKAEPETVTDIITDTSTDATIDTAIIDMKLINKAFEICTSEEDETHISKLGLTLRKLDPSFDIRSYGFKSLTQLFQSLDRYTVVTNVVNGLNHPIVKLK